MKAKTAIIPFERIAMAIHLIRGQKVMLDRDLALLYGVETRVLNQAVRRNYNRFPPDFMLTLAREEIRNISQIVICSDIKHAKNVFAFTEQGVAMLSSVLNSQQAIEVNIAIMRAFVRMREFLASQAKLGKKLRDLEHKVESHHESIHVLFEAIQQLTSE
ncbi:MAG: ORF6N domain-containing protein, partial [Kiritimatiellota bacterium]|nr:ORF6N domain-containing protein [Kiritimatiellota bacterium]